MAAVLFYYKDMELINSLYAQLFAGLLQEKATSNSGQQASEREARGQGHAGVAAFLTGQLEVEVRASRTEQSEFGHTETIFPHDAIVLDVLEQLAPSMKTSVASANRGDILNLKGAITLFPNELGNDGFEPLISLIMKTQALPAELKNKDTRKSFIDLARKIIKASGENIRFVFKAESGEYLTGFLKNKGFLEENFTLFMKYKAQMIPCQFIAIFEGHIPEKLEITGEGFFSGIYAFSSMTAELWAQGLPESIPVTPITFFLPLNLNA